MRSTIVRTNYLIQPQCWKIIVLWYQMKTSFCLAFLLLGLFTWIGIPFKKIFAYLAKKIPQPILRLAVWLNSRVSLPRRQHNYASCLFRFSSILSLHPIKLNWNTWLLCNLQPESLCFYTRIIHWFLREWTHLPTDPWTKLFLLRSVLNKVQLWFPN